MKITIHQPYALHAQGGRSGQEDSIYPALTAPESLKSNIIFVVCDGVGGFANGEIASQLVAETIGKVLTSVNYFNEKWIHQAVAYSEATLDEYRQQHPESFKMATTLALLHLNQEGVTLAHVGDSRIYQISSQGALIFKTEDHSYVNDLVKAGILSPEEAPYHPKRNIITRAIYGQARPVKADIILQKDVQAGDYFILCTDGILEQVTESFLLELLGNQNLDNETKISMIEQCCAGKTKDNFSCYLIQVESVTGGETRKPLAPALKKQVIEVFPTSFEVTMIQEVVPIRPNLDASNLPSLSNELVLESPLKLEEPVSKVDETMILANVKQSVAAKWLTKAKPILIILILGLGLYAFWVVSGWLQDKTPIKKEQKSKINRKITTLTI